MGAPALAARRRFSARAGAAASLEFPNRWRAVPGDGSPSCSVVTASSPTAMRRDEGGRPRGMLSARSGTHSPSTQATPRAARHTLATSPGGARYASLIKRCPVAAIASTASEPNASPQHTREHRVSEAASIGVAWQRSHLMAVRSEGRRRGHGLDGVEGMHDTDGAERTPGLEVAGIPAVPTCGPRQRRESDPPGMPARWPPARSVVSRPKPIRSRPIGEATPLRRARSSRRSRIDSRSDWAYLTTSDRRCLAERISKSRGGGDVRKATIRAAEPVQRHNPGQEVLAGECAGRGAPVLRQRLHAGASGRC